MKFAIQINSAPWESQGGETAYQFSRAAIGMGHEVVRVFFYYEGAYTGLRWMEAPDGEKAIVSRWSALAEDQGVDLVICISAAQRRGIVEPTEAKQLSKHHDALADGFRIAGLGLWVDACLKADRFLVFGG